MDSVIIGVFSETRILYCNTFIANSAVFVDLHPCEWHFRLFLYRMSFIVRAACHIFSHRSTSECLAFAVMSRPAAWEDVSCPELSFGDNDSDDDLADEVILSPCLHQPVPLNGAWHAFFVRHSYTLDQE